MRVNLRILITGLVFFILYVVSGYVYLANSLERLYNTKYEEVSNRMQRELEVLIKEKLEAVLLLDIALSQSQDIRELLLSKNSEDLKLDKYAQLLRENTPLKNIWFHVVDNEGVSLYRSWTKERNDSLVGIRFDIDAMLKNPHMMSSVSTGKFDMTFKSMVPVYEEDSFIGIVETIARFDSIVIKLKNYKFETLVLVDKKYKEQLTHTLGDHFLEGYYVTSFSGSEKLMNLVTQKGVEYFTTLKEYLVDKENKQLLSLYKLPDRNGDDMGYFLMAIDLKNIDTQSIEDSEKRIIFGLTLGFFIITGFLSYLYMVNYKNFIQRQRKKLEETVAQKIQELRQQSEEMQHLAHHDSLTNLPNRLLFLQKLQEAIEEGKAKEQEVGVLFLDLDSFKEINDTYGHKMGDSLLQKITQRLKGCVRDTDTVARLGGDEFTIIVHNPSQDSLKVVAEKIINEIQKPFKLDGVEFFVTFSIGLSLYPHDGESPELLLKYADTAMYRAKDEGKNRYQLYNASMTEMAVSKINLQNALREAIALEQFEPYYQPKIDAKSGKVIGLEALVRWNHPQRGLVTPFDFIPFAEEIGIITEIDALVLHAALRQMKLWQAEGLETGRLSLNISSRQLDNVECVDTFRDALKRMNFKSEFLELEVTESQIMRSQTRSIQILNALKALGITISMDDFGTGYSSLSYLKNLPVDILKIDRSFIEDTPDNKDDVAIVKTIISLAKNLEIDIIAEGVERKEQVDFLLGEGCSKIQGYYYSKPLNEKECRAFLIHSMKL